MNEKRERFRQNNKTSQEQKQVRTNGYSNAKNKKYESRVVTTGEIWRTIFEIVSQPILMVGFQVICDKEQCSFTSWPNFSQYSNISAFFSLKCLLVYLGFITVMFLLGVVPVGGKRIRIDDYTYNLNGFSLSLFMILSLIVFEIVGIPASAFICDHILHLVVSTLIFQVSLGIFLYLFSYTVRQDQLNPNEMGTPFITSFYNGRQINPRLFNLFDVKFMFLRNFTIPLILADIAMVLRSLNLTSSAGLNFDNLNWKALSSHPTIVVLAFFHCTYCLFHLYNESRILNNYFTRSEGMGYNTLMANSFRWSGLIAQTRYIMEHKIHYENWELLGLLIIYLFAKYIYIKTNNQKDHFRAFPNSPESKKMKKIPTSTGKDILCDGWWGRLRQPNISADVLIHLTWLRFAFTAPPVLSVLAIIYYLIDRAIVSQRDCKMKYGLAWKKYCNNVKYVLVPFLY